MRRFCFTLVLFLMVPLFAAGVQAAGHPTVEKKKKEAGVYHGVVSELDLKKKKMIVTKKNTDLSMVFNTSKMKAGSGYKDVEEVKTGDQVVVKFGAKIGNIYALAISREDKVPAPPQHAAKSPHP